MIHRRLDDHHAVKAAVLALLALDPSPHEETGERGAPHCRFGRVVVGAATVSDGAP